MSEKKTLETIGDYNVKTIKKRTRLGKGADKDGGPQTKLKIKPRTKQVRKGLKKKGKLSGKTSPSKANLTRTGKMLDTLHSKVDRADSSVTTKVAPDQQHKVNELENQGHKFLHLTKGEFKGLVETLVRGLLKRTK